jgi:hypothetical protein
MSTGIPFYIDGQENYGAGGENSLSASAMHDLSAIITSGKVAPNFEDTPTGQRIEETTEYHNRMDSRNRIATSIVSKMFKAKKLKSDIGDELYQIANKVKLLLKEG